MTLGVVGIKMPENPNLPRSTKTVPLKIEAASDLNADEDGHGLSTIVRLYKLKDQNAFLAAPYSAFGYPEKEKQAFGADLTETKEFVLPPGQTLELKEKIAGEAVFLGIVTLFRSPAPKRWRFAFAVAEAESAGVILGLHTCAMTATSAVPIGMTLNEASLLSPVKCQ